MSDLFEVPSRARLAMLKDRLQDPESPPPSWEERRAFVEAIEIIEESMSQGDDVPMTPFFRCVAPTIDYPDHVVGELAQKTGMTVEETQNALANATEGDWFRNNIYQVVRRIDEFPSGRTFHLSIKRLDQKPVRSWRDFQRIKNELIGPEYEAVEIYPADERLVDTANQYHLWGFAIPEYRLPFGFNERLVSDDFPDTGAVQQKFSDISS